MERDSAEINLQPPEQKSEALRLEKNSLSKNGVKEPHIKHRRMQQNEMYKIYVRYRLHNISYSCLLLGNLNKSMEVSGESTSRQRSGCREMRHCWPPSRIHEVPHCCSSRVDGINGQIQLCKNWLVVPFCDSQVLRLFHHLETTKIISMKFCVHTVYITLKFDMK
jgi:hypothetical protein